MFCKVCVDEKENKISTLEKTNVGLIVCIVLCFEDAWEGKTSKLAAEYAVSCYRRRWL